MIRGSEGPAIDDADGGGLLTGPPTTSSMDRADVDTDDLLTVILVLAAVWLLLEILGAALELTALVLDVLPTLLVVAIVVLIALRLSDRI